MTAAGYGWYGAPPWNGVQIPARACVRACVRGHVSCGCARGDVGFMIPMFVVTLHVRLTYEAHTVSPGLLAHTVDISANANQTNGGGLVGHSGKKNTNLGAFHDRRAVACMATPVRPLVVASNNRRHFELRFFLFPSPSSLR